ncbi:hypothetical protein T440DRAFT_505369 [Plenodomus tracheiphilus IPT5]|uniref:Uncharacterized protein n=1 Tax=Plenodomus tracheiphilus IPT5 TaxID=1408161 RepID=A0A6A7BFV3_9PLEO|nr:hypothetical protein T440DRAFT_505369 [Plenodomus tracheiphilus IPT5]
MSFQTLLRKLKQKKKEKVDRKFHLTGMRNVDILLDVEEVNYLQPEPHRQAPQRNSAAILGNLLADAQMGHDDFESPKQMEEKRRKKEEYERSLAQSRRYPVLPSLKDLQRLTNALQDGSAFKGDSYRPTYRNTLDDTASAQQTLRQRNNYTHVPPPHTSSVYHIPLFALKSNRTSCQVSLCPHEHYTIDWDISDPDNKNSSWIASLRHYWDHATSRDDHKKCPRPNEQPRCKILAERIVATFMVNEQRKLSDSERRRGETTRRPPSSERVYREVRIMYSHLFRGNTEDIIEKKEEAARKNQDPATQRDKLAEQTQQQAQRERQRKELAKGLNIDDLEANEQPVTTSSKKRALSEDQDGARPLAQEMPNKKQKVSAPAEDRLKATTIEERKERAAQMAVKLTKAHATKIPSVAEKPKAVSSKQINVAPVADSYGDAPAASQVSASKPQDVKKRNELTSAERKLLKGSQQAEIEESMTQVPEMVKTPAENPQARVNNEDEQILAKLAEKERQNILITMSVKKVIAPKTLILQEIEKEVECAWENFDTALKEKSTVTEIEPTVIEVKEDSIDSNSSDYSLENTMVSMFDRVSQLPYPPPPPSPEKQKFSNKRDSRRASLVKSSEDLATRTVDGKTQMSAAVIEDSDEETDYVLPKVETRLPESEVHGEFETESVAIVEGVVQQQEELAEQREEMIESGAGAVVLETIEAVGTLDTSMTESHDETQSSIDQSGAENTSSPPSSPPPLPFQKRKRSSADSSSSRSLKKLKTKRSMTPPYVSGAEDASDQVDDLVDEVAMDIEKVDGPDSLDDLFEELENH